MAKKIIISALAAIVLAAPSLVSAQTNGAYNYQGYNTDYQCQQKVNNNQTTGGLVGAVAGAAIGSNVAGKGVRKEGAVLGAVLGAVVGSQVGKNRIACDDQYQYEQDKKYKNYGQYNKYENHGHNKKSYSYGHDDNYYNQGTYQGGYSQGGYNQGGYNQGGYNNGYQNGQYQYPVSYNNNCGWGKAAYRLPDGRMVSEQVYMCRQHDGDWVVVSK